MSSGRSPWWAGLILVPSLLIGWVWVDANLWERQTISVGRLDSAIARGLDRLDASDRYRRRIGSHGVFPVELWMTRRLLALAPHEGLAADVEHGRQSLLESPLRFLARLPGEPWPTPSDDEIAAVAAFVERDYIGQSTVDGPAWSRWFLYSAYPEVRYLIPGDFLGMLSEEWGVSYGFQLSHRIYAYRLFRQMNPALAAKYEIPALEARAMSVMKREMVIDPRLYDLYYERLAFALEYGAVSPFLGRWIERVLDAQNPDGSWHRTPRLGCDFANAFGIECRRGAGNYHPTFLATYALAQYRVLLDARAPAAPSSNGGGGG